MVNSLYSNDFNTNDLGGQAKSARSILFSFIAIEHLAAFTLCDGESVSAASITSTRQPIHITSLETPGNDQI